MNPLSTTKQEPFGVGTGNLEFFHKRFSKMTGGMILFCVRGEADMTLDLGKFHVVPDVIMILLPNSIFTLTAASADFQVQFFTYSEEMFKTACFRMEPSFIHFMEENPCHLLMRAEQLRAVSRLMEAGCDLVDDVDNRSREMIAQNLLQIFFLDTYDKVQRHFMQGRVKGGKRKEELFEKFMQQVHACCTTQRDAAFYAKQLCITTRYLSAITRKISGHPTKKIIDDFLTLELKVALLSTGLSLKEIAEKYNFPDQSAFARYFKKQTGVSPKSFRLDKV